VETTYAYCIAFLGLKDSIFITLLYYICSASEQARDFCEHGNEPLGSIKCGEFLD
jgi:hypothetical protein